MKEDIIAKLQQAQGIAEVLMGSISTDPAEMQHPNTCIIVDDQHGDSVDMRTYATTRDSAYEISSIILDTLKDYKINCGVVCYKEGSPAGAADFFWQDIEVKDTAHYGND